MPLPLSAFGMNAKSEWSCVNKKMVLQLHVEAPFFIYLLPDIPLNTVNCNGNDTIKVATSSTERVNVMP